MVMFLAIGGGIFAYIKDPQQTKQRFNNVIAAITKAVSSEGSARTGDKVSVQVNSSPKGATISVDGTAIAKKTPTKITLPPGDYEVQLTLDGYTPVSRKVSVQKDSPLTISETLEK
jgi:hypothetical protein